MIWAQVCAIFAEFFSPYTEQTRFVGYQQGPPVVIHVICPQGLQRPFVYGRTKKLNQKTFKYDFTNDTTKILPIHFFVKGEDGAERDKRKADGHFVSV